MPRPSPQHPRARWTWPAVGAFSLLLTLCFLVPWRPYFVRTAALDDSWMLALNWAFANHLQFGRDIVFTFGPWGFLNTRCYYPQTFGLMLAGWAFFALIFWRVNWIIARRHLANPAIAFLWLIATVGIAAMTVFAQSATLLSLVSLLVVFYFYCNSRSFPWTSALLLAAVALASLIKFTYFAAAVLVIVPIAVDQIRRRQLPTALMLFVAFFLAFYLLAGQRLSSLWPYLRLSSAMAGGYTDAMSFSIDPAPIGPFHNIPPLDLLLFLLAGALLLAAVLAAGWKRNDLAAGLLPFVAIAGLLFTFCKWGYVRHDQTHAPLAALALLFLAAICLPALRARLPGNRWRIRLGLVGAVATLVGWTLVRAVTGQSLPSYFAHSLICELRLDVTAAFQLARASSSPQNDYAKALDDIRKFSPVPVVHGTVDVYPWNQAIATAYDLPYRPRPVFQSYGAYLPELARLNAAHLLSPDAPDTILFGVTNDSVGLRHFPAFDDGFSWPQLLTLYDIRGSSSGFLVLHKLDHPRDYRLVPIANRSAELNQPIDVPTTEAGPIWAQITVQPSAQGKLLSMLYKDPELWMTVVTRDGQSQRLRFIAGAAEAGFVLSPAVLDVRAFASLASTIGGSTGNDVKTITIEDHGWIGKNWAYRRTIAVTFQRLHFPPQPTASRYADSITRAD
jgi:hypothetical protein